MLKFMAGLAVGILGCTLYRISDTADRIICGVVGILLGAAILFAMFIGFMSKDKSKQQQSSGPWWKNGDKPPWEREEYDPHADNND